MQRPGAPSRRGQQRPASAATRSALRPEKGGGGGFGRPGSAPVRRQGSAATEVRLPPPELSVSFGGWKKRLAQVDAQRSGTASGRCSPKNSLVSVDERGASPMVTRSHSMFERPSSAERPESDERAWKPRVAEEWSQSLVPKQRFRSNWLRCVGAYHDLQQDFPDVALPPGTAPTPRALAAHLRMLDMLIALAKQAGDVPGCNQDEYNMLCAIRTTCLAALYVPPESVKAQLATRAALNDDHSNYEERQMCCSRTSVMETQVRKTAEERDRARRRVSELEAALDQESVERARLQSKVSALEASALILEKAVREEELENNAQKLQIRRLEAAIEDTSESARLQRMRRELEQGRERVKKALEIEASSVGRINQAEDCVAEMQTMVTQANAERAKQKAALDAAGETSADLRAQIETLNKVIDGAAERQLSNGKELAILRKYHEQSESQRLELTPRPDWKRLAEVVAPLPPSQLSRSSEDTPATAIDATSSKELQTYEIVPQLEEQDVGSRRNARETAEALAESLFAKQQLEEELGAARLAVASLNVDWSKFVDKGVHALPLSKKTKKAAAARAKKIAANKIADAELALAQKEHEGATNALDGAPTVCSGEARVGEATRVGVSDGNAPESPDALEKAISGVLEA